MSSKKIRKANINGVLYDLTVQDAELYNDVIIKLKRDGWVSAVVEGESVFTQTVHVDGATADSTPAIFLQGSNNLGGTDEEYEAYSKLINVITSSNQFIFVASEAPTIDFIVISKATIAAEGSQITEIEELRKANTYSTEETVVGTWIDGRPIYRKVINITNQHSTAFEQELDVQNIDALMIKNAYIINSDTTTVTPIPYFISASDFMSIRVLNGAIQVIKSSESAWEPNSITLILEYTKTTDTPPNA